MMTKKRLFNSATALVTASALSLSLAQNAVAAEVEDPRQQVSVITATYDANDKLSTRELELALQTIESIPDSALKDEGTFEQWKQQNIVPATQSRASVIGCAWGITKALVSNVFVFPKYSSCAM